MVSITERVDAGAAFLDIHDPDWWKAGVPGAINLETLALSSSESCVLGQRCPLEVAARYATAEFPWIADEDAGRADALVAIARFAAYATVLSALAGADMVDWAWDHGFTLPFGEDILGDRTEAWAELTDIWRVLITERRKLARDGRATA